MMGDCLIFSRASFFCHKPVRDSYIDVKTGSDAAAIDVCRGTHRKIWFYRRMDRIGKMRSRAILLYCADRMCGWKGGRKNDSGRVSADAL